MTRRARRNYTPALKTKVALAAVKTERVNRKIHRTRDDARADVFDYIERLYNPRRRRSTFGYQSPIAFEA